jgi:hypothetical protein
MTVNIAGRSVALGEIVAAVGGLVAIIGVPLAWASATIGGDTSNLNGLDADLNGGKVALVLGILVVALVVAGILNVKIPQASAILVVLGALILVVVGLVYFTSMLGKASLKDTADLVSAAGGTFGFGIGLILEVVGGIVVIVGGGLGLMKKSA